MLQIFVPKYSKSIWAEDTLVPPLWENGEKQFFFFVHAAARRGICAFTLKIVNTLIKNS